MVGKDEACRRMGGERLFQALHELGMFSVWKSCRIAHSQSLAGGRSITMHVSFAWYFQPLIAMLPFLPHYPKPLLHYK